MPPPEYSADGRSVESATNPKRWTFAQMISMLVATASALLILLNATAPTLIGATTDGLIFIALSTPMLLLAAWYWRWLRRNQLQQLSIDGDRITLTEGRKTWTWRWDQIDAMRVHHHSVDGALLEIRRFDAPHSIVADLQRMIGPTPPAGDVRLGHLDRSEADIFNAIETFSGGSSYGLR